MKASKACMYRMAITAAAAILMTGCTDQLRTERDALRVENSELRVELGNSQAALDSALSVNASLNQQVRDLHGQSSSHSVSALPSGAIADTGGFAAIEEVEAINDGRQITVRVPGDILFDSGKVTLKSSARRTLGAIAQVIKNDYPANMIRVSGFTDTDPIRRSKWSDNLELSMQRAASVHRYLQKQGVAPTQLYAAGFGQWQPRATKAKSRRVELVVELATPAFSSAE